MSASSSSGAGNGAFPLKDGARAPEMMGRYAPVARLGKGGMADVFLTLAHGLQGVNKLAVVKRLRNSEDLALTEMFLDEARLCVLLNHPNIVHTYEVGEARGEYFIAMEYLEGQPLSRLLKTLEERCEGLPEPLVAFIAIQVLKGLNHAHEFCDFDGTPLEVVHRDVSPHNLFLTYGGEIKLLDFGIAKATMNATHTEDGVLKGKVRYMAPEQATQRDLDRRVDIFAFGIVLWEMLARRALFTGPPLSILNRLMNEEIPPVRGVRPDVSPVLEAIALKAARRNRDERYATAEEMRLDLEAYLRERRDEVPERELARIMNELFATIRDDVRARIKAYISTMPVQRGMIPGSPGITSTGKLPVLPSWSSPPSAPSWSSPMSSPVAEDSSPRASAPPPPVRRSRHLPGVVFFLLLFLAVAGTGLFVVKSPRWRSLEEPSPPVAIPAPVLANDHVASAQIPPVTRAASPGGNVGSPPADGPGIPSAATPGGNSPREPHHIHAHPASAPPIASATPSPSASAPARPKILMLDDSETP